MKWPISELLLASLLNRGQVQNRLYENKFSFKSNSEMGFLFQKIVLMEVTFLLNKLNKLQKDSN